MPRATIVAITTRVAPGLGSPTKYFLSARGSTVTLNRARRKAAQASHRNAESQARTGFSGSAQVCTSTAGASPKDTRSDNESSWTPNGDVAPTSRATAPSAMSSTIEPASMAAAQVKWSPNASRTAEKPHAMLPVVSMLGEVTRSRSRVFSCRNETTAAPEGDLSRHRSSSRRPDFSVAGLSGDSLVRAGHRAITLSPATVRSPATATRSTSGGTKTSIREPNFIRPIRWPVRSTSPADDTGHHPACDQADDLAEHDAPLVAVDVVDQADLAALVLGRALEPVGRVPLAGTVGDLLDPAGVRRPVDVHVEEGEEDADLLPAAGRSDPDLARPDVHHLAVGGSQDEVPVDLSVVGRTVGIAEECGDADGKGEQ